MAGEWLKFESNLPEKPETLAITVAMGWDDPDLTVGKLMRVFRWFDQHTIDGNAHGVTAALLDRLIGVPGFVQAMANAGWIVVSPEGLALHNFDRHNGATAKSRAQTAKRVANHRGNGEGNAESNAPTVTTALAREEKRREEEKTTTANAVVRKPRGSRLPEGWEPSEDGRAYASARGLNPQDELDAFRDHWTAESRATASKLDWNAAWRTWCRNAVKFKPTAARNVGVTTPAAETVAQYQVRVAEERAAALKGVTAPPREVLELAGKLRMQ